MAGAAQARAAGLATHATQVAANRINSTHSRHTHTRRVGLVTCGAFQQRIAKGPAVTERSKAAELAEEIPDGAAAERSCEGSGDSEEQNDAEGGGVLHGNL